MAHIVLVPAATHFDNREGTSANISLEEPEYGTDSGLWKEITENIWAHCLDKGPSVCQNHDCDFQSF